MTHLNSPPQDWQPLGNKMEFNTMYREHFCREIPVHHEMVPRVVESAVRSARKKRPHTTTSGKKRSIPRSLADGDFVGL